MDEAPRTYRYRALPLLVLGISCGVLALCVAGAAAFFVHVVPLGAVCLGAIALVIVVLIYLIVGRLPAETRFDGTVLDGFDGRCDITEISSVTRELGCLRIRRRGRLRSFYVPDDPDLARRLQAALAPEVPFGRTWLWLERILILLVGVSGPLLPLIFGHAAVVYFVGGWPRATPGAGQEILYRGLSAWDIRPGTPPAAGVPVDLGAVRLKLRLEEVRLACPVGDLPIYDVYFTDGSRLTVSPQFGELADPAGTTTPLARLLPPAWTGSETAFLLHALATTPADHRFLMGPRELVGLAVAARIHWEDRPDADGYRHLARPPLDLFWHRRAKATGTERVRVVVAGRSSFSLTLGTRSGQERAPASWFGALSASLALRPQESLEVEALLARGREAQAAAAQGRRGEAMVGLVSAMGLDPSVQAGTWLTCWELVADELQASPDLSLGNRLDLARRTLRRWAPRGDRLLARLEALDPAVRPRP